MPTGILSNAVPIDRSGTLRLSPSTAGAYAAQGIAAVRPTAPTLLPPTAGNTTATLTWTAPVSNGGSPITDYIVKRSTNGGTNWTRIDSTVSTLTSYVATGLTNGTAYVFKVIAVNAVGISLPSATSSPVTPVSVPSAAVLLSVVAGNTTATLTWTAPVSNGGSPITDYIVKRSTNSGTTWTRIVRPVSTLTSYVATGLTNGTAYVFKVIAVNAIGISLPSAASSPVTPALPA